MLFASTFPWICFWINFWLIIFLQNCFVIACTVTTFTRALIRHIQVNFGCCRKFRHSYDTRSYRCICGTFTFSFVYSRWTTGTLTMNFHIYKLKICLLFVLGQNRRCCEISRCFANGYSDHTKFWLYKFISSRKLRVLCSYHRTYIEGGWKLAFYIPISF